MKTKQKAIRRTPSASDFVSSDLSPAFEPICCPNQPLKRKYPSSEASVLTTSSTNSTKKICATDSTVEQPEPEFINDRLSTNGCRPCSSHTHDPSSSSMSCQCQHRPSNAPSSSDSQEKYMHNKNPAASAPTQIQSRKVIIIRQVLTAVVKDQDLYKLEQIIYPVRVVLYAPMVTTNDALGKHNDLVKLFRTARDKIESRDVPSFKLKLFGVVGSRQYDKPAGDSIGAIVFEGGPDVKTEYDVVIERRGGQPQRIDKLNPHYMSLHFPLLHIHGDSIGAIVFEGGPDVKTEYDVVIERRGGQPQRIDKLNPHYMSLHFPLLHIHGEEGYHLGLKLLDKAGKPPEKDKHMTMKMYYAYNLHDQLNQFSLLKRDMINSKVLDMLQGNSHAFNSNDEALPKTNDGGATELLYPEKAIVCPKNETADMINSKVLDMLQGDSHAFNSNDEALPKTNDGGAIELLYPVELTAGTSENISLRTSLGKEIITQPQSTKLLSLKPTELDKSIYVKVYRKWTIINKASIPVLYCCILLDQEQPKQKPNRRVEESTSVSSSTALKDKRKTTTARRPLFQTTKNEPEKPNPKRTKKDD
ncbi:hypothetical protein CTI12_AA602330 [Artemisia annua]|uniref:Uncharacterized protein n=1 Tax=Artemisia annua TaxID=35608 RepID=A0A2U1KHC8_ARTAN|nr:hypothetical protein CTI12_AA602330 [Artemisia annua]